MQTRNIGIILLIGLLIMASIVTTLPYDTFQFIDQTTNANTTSFFNGDYNGKLLYADWNKIGFIDINDLNIGSATDFPNPDLSGLVPYTGATKNVDLGSHNLNVNADIKGDSLSIDNGGSNSFKGYADWGYLYFGDGAGSQDSETGNTIWMGSASGGDLSYWINGAGQGGNIFDIGSVFGPFNSMTLNGKDWTIGDSRDPKTSISGNNGVIRVIANGEQMFYTDGEYTSIKNYAIPNNEAIYFGGGGNPSGANTSISQEAGDNDYVINPNNRANSTQGQVNINGNLLVYNNNVIGAEKISNGTFTGSASGWDLGSGWVYNSNNVKSVLNVNVNLKQSSSNMVTPIVAGEFYELKLSIIDSTGVRGLNVFCGGWESRKHYVHISGSDIIFRFRAINNNGLEIESSNKNAVVIVDNVSLKRISSGNFYVAGNIEATEIKAKHKTADGTNPVANGTYTMGIGNNTNGTITIKDGLIVNLTQAS